MERVDTSLNYVGRKFDTFNGKRLHQRFVNDTAAHVAADRTGNVEIAPLVNVDGKVNAGAGGHLENEEAEKRACGTSANDRDARALVEGEVVGALGFADLGWCRACHWTEARHCSGSSCAEITGAAAEFKCFLRQIS